jgi:hypothetical protein
MGGETKILSGACLFFHECVVFPAPTCGGDPLCQSHLKFPTPAFSVACTHLPGRDHDWPVVCNCTIGMFT